MLIRFYCCQVYLECYNTATYIGVLNLISKNNHASSDSERKFCNQYYYSPVQLASSDIPGTRLIHDTDAPAL